jgi:hypothetical protein
MRFRGKVIVCILVVTIRISFVKKAQLRGDFLDIWLPFPRSEDSRSRSRDGAEDRGVVVGSEVA